MTASITDTAYQKAIGILEGNLTKRGLVASRDWYKEVFARDSAITFIGASLLEDKRIYAALKTTLATLVAGQDVCGMVPTCVHDDTGQANFGTIDSTAWVIVMHYVYYRCTGDKAFITKQYPALVRAVRCLQANGRRPDDCIWSQESDDWNDAWSNHGQTLFVNVVYQAALKYMAVLAAALNKRADSAAFRASHLNVRRRINDTLWVPESIDKVDTRSTQAHQQQYEQLRAFAKSRGPMRHYLAFMSRGFIGSFCDVMSNAMAIVFGVSDAYRTGRILDYFHEAGVDEPYPARVIYPPVQEGSEHWRDYYYTYNLNLPHHYHNGGCWPHCGGFHVAAHVKAGRMDEAARHLARLAEFNRLGKTGEWEFVEWAHGGNGRPWGSRYMSWSAGMYIFAHQAVRDPHILDILDPE